MTDNNQTRKIDMSSLQAAVLGVKAIFITLSDNIIKKTKEVFDNNSYSNAISGTVDTLTGAQLNNYAIPKNISLNDRLGNLILQTRKVSTGASTGAWVAKNSPIGTTGTTLYGLYKDFNKYAGLDMKIAMGLTLTATAGSLVIGKGLDKAGATLPTILVVGAGTGTFLCNKADELKEIICTEEPAAGRTDIPHNQGESNS